MMEALYALCEWLESTRIAVAVAESLWLFPALESLHVIALALMVGSIAMLDLRLLGVTSRNLAVTKLSAEVLPYTWAAFAVAALTGGLLFASNATYYFENGPFRIKIVLLLLAGLNMALFHLVTWRRVHEWDRSASTALAAKAAGGLSLSFWVLVVFFGRWIAFA